MDTKQETHPLLQKELRMLRHWRLWKEAWDKTVNAEELMGLLHVACDMETQEGESLERFTLLLEVADGYQDRKGLTKPEDYPTFGVSWGTLAPIGPVSEPVQIRSAIAAKAMRVLRDRILKYEPTKQRYMPWLVVEPEGFAKLLWFFDDADRRLQGYNLAVCDDGRLNADVRTFAWALICSGWRFMPGAFGEFSHDDTGRLRDMFAAARPRFVRMLFRMGRLGSLIDVNKRWQDMGESEMDVLSAVALRRSSIADFGSYDGLGEALCEGSQAAQVLIAVEACLKEQARKRRIADAERTKREAEQEIEAASRT